MSPFTQSKYSMSRHRMFESPADMPHGETSCVVIPHVLRYNSSTNADRQAVISSILGSSKPLVDIIADFIAHLKLPGRLRTAGVFEAVLETVAQAAVHEPLLASNPRPITSLADTLQLLRQAW